MAHNSFVSDTASQLLIPLETSSRGIFEPKQKVSVQLVQKDIDRLICSLQLAYAGWEQLKGPLEKEIFPKLRGFQRPSTSTAEICEFIGKILNDLPDHHLGIYSFGSDVRCGKTSVKKGSVGKNIDAEKFHAWAYFERKIVGKTIPVISINRLPPPGDGWQGFEEKIQDLSQNAPALILDIRGVHGGDDEVTHDMARILMGLKGSNANLAPSATVIQRQTPEAIALFLNTLGVAILKQKFAGKPHKQLDGYYQEYLDLLKESQGGNLPAIEETKRKLASVNLSQTFRGPIRILVDSECESGCESIIEFFEKHPKAKTVGENSAGLVHFGQVGTLWLENTNLFVDISTRSFKYDDGRFVEKVGYRPTISVPAGKDALDVAIKDLEHELNVN